MKIKIRKSAVKDLEKLDPNIRKRLHDKILSLAKFPETPNIKRLTNFEPAYRMRVGDYRVLFDVSNEIIEIGRVLHRKDSY